METCEFDKNSSCNKIQCLASSMSGMNASTDMLTKTASMIDGENPDDLTTDDLEKLVGIGDFLARVHACALQKCELDK